MPVSDKEQQQINSLVARFEADTGIQAVAAVVGKSDAYPEIPWKAYAIGFSRSARSPSWCLAPFADWSVATTIAFQGLSQYTPAAELERIASAMKPPLGTQGPAAAFEIAFDALQALLRARGVAASQTRNELDDAVVMEKGR